MAAPTAAAVRAGDVAPLGRDALLARRPRAAREREPGVQSCKRSARSLAGRTGWTGRSCVHASQVRIGVDARRRCAAHGLIRMCGGVRPAAARCGAVGGKEGGGVSVAGCVQVIALRTRSVAGGGGQAEGGREEGGDYSSVVEGVRRGEGRANGSATGWQSARWTLRARDCSLARLAGRRRAPARSPPTRTHTWARAPARSLT